MSHEINNSLTPIASISESLQVQCAQNLTNAETQSDLKEGLQVISDRAQSLNNFINSYHQLSTLPKPIKSVVNLPKYIGSITSLYPAVDWFIDDKLQLDIFIDSQQMQQVLVNLITNAIEASSSADKIFLSINCKVTTDKLVIELLDNGSGIANLDNLFVPFYSPKTKGSGIGLVLSRQIIMNHDGDLQLQNREDNQGVKASIYLPLTV